MINKCDFDVFRSNIVSDVSDHYSQFCTLHSKTEKFNNKRIRRDFSGFSESSFSDELSQLLNNENMFSPIKDADIAFSKFYNTLNSLVNKHPPLKVFSKRKLKQFSKPWKTSGMRKSIKIQKNSLLILDTTIWPGSSHLHLSISSLLQMKAKPIVFSGSAPMEYLSDLCCGVHRWFFNPLFISALADISHIHLH